MQYDKWTIIIVATLFSKSFAISREVTKHDNSTVLADRSYVRLFIVCANNDSDINENPGAEIDIVLEQ